MCVIVGKIARKGCAMGLGWLGSVYYHFDTVHIMCFALPNV